MSSITKNYRWLVVKEELVDSQAAAADALHTSPHNVKNVMLVSQFVQTLGAIDVDQDHRHA